MSRGPNQGTLIKASYNHILNPSVPTLSSSGRALQPGFSRLCDDPHLRRQEGGAAGGMKMNKLGCGGDQGPGGQSEYKGRQGCV